MWYIESPVADNMNYKHKETFMLFAKYHDTTMGYKLQPNNKQASEVATRYINGTLGAVFMKVGSTKIIGIVDDKSDDLGLQYPVYFGDRQDICVIDLSRFMARGSTISNYKVSSQRDLQLMLSMTVLEAQWAKREYSKWKVEYAEAGGWFVSFLSKRITSHFNLDPYETSKLDTLISMYYNALITPGWAARGMDVNIRDITKHSYTNKDVIQDVYDSNPKYENLNELAVSIEKLLTSPKLRGFDAVTLLNLTESGSFGMSVDTITGIGLEYPPFWVALMYVNINDKSYRNTFLARLVKRPSERLAREMTTLLKQGKEND